MRLSKLFITASVLVLSAAAAVAQEQPLRDLTVEQSATAQVVAPHAGTLKATLAADRADNTYAVGETVKLQVTTNEDAYVTVLDVGPSGQATQLFPNKYQTDNHLLANHPVEIAGAATGAKIVVSAPTGTDFIKVISSNKPITVVPESQLQGAGAFHSVDGGANALVRDLQVAAEPPAQTDTKIAFNNFALYTIATRAPAPTAGQTIVVIPAPPTAPAPAPTVHIAVAADQPFPLLVAADKATYKVGEKVTLAVTSVQACNLTVLEFAASGQVHTLYPNAASPSPAIAALQTVFVTGGSSTNALQVAGPAGSEQILAVCASADTAPTPAPDKAAEAGTISRDLAVVASHPGTASASVVFAVTP